MPPYFLGKFSMQLKTSQQHRKTLALTGSLLALMALGACGNAIDDQAVARQTEQAAKQAIDKSKAITEQSIAYASGLMSNAAQKAQVMGAEAAIAAGNVVDDAVITTIISAGLAKDAQLNKTKIDVTTSAGVVTLTGPAPSAALKDKVAELAKTTVGVKSVDNQLVLQGS
jgi:osmotically-inducible protein OsmY